jgi:DNA replication protein DnaC
MSRHATTGLYEQLKDDLGYLQLNRAAECFAGFADDARTRDWTHIEYLARVVAAETTATRDRRLAARLRYARFPFHKTIEDFDFEFQPSVSTPFSTAALRRSAVRNSAAGSTITPVPVGSPCSSSFVTSAASRWPTRKYPASGGVTLRRWRTLD